MFEESETGELEQGTDSDVTPAVQVTPVRPLVLVVDDDALNRTVLGAMLRQLGYQFHVATNGREAVEATRHERYAAVLMDCLMPVLDGYDATRMIREDEFASQSAEAQRRVPVIAVTAVAIQGARERCIAAGMDDYLSKPIVVQTLAGVLDHWTANLPTGATWTPEREAGQAATEEPLLDHQALETLRALDPEDGDAFLSAVLGDFLTDVEPRFLAIRAATACGDTSIMTQELHSIAGCAAMVGASQVERLARAIQTAVATSKTAALSARVDQLEAAFARTRIAMESVVNF